MPRSIGDALRKSVLGTSAALLLSSAGLSVAAPLSDLPVFMPPAIDYRKTCSEPAGNRPTIGIDWTAWNGAATNRSNDDLLDLMDEYATGSVQLARSPDTSDRILDYLATNRRVGAGLINFLYGQSRLRRIDDAAALAEAEAYFQKSLKAGYSRAALALGQYYSTNGPVGTRDPARAARYFRMASAAGDPEGQLGLARLYAADVSKSPEEKRFQILNAMIGLDRAIKGGRCGYIKRIAGLYLRGDLVAQNSDVAIAWYEKAADLGDAATAETLARLLASFRATSPDYKRAFRYFQAAADKGRPYSALTVGKAYATGIGRDRNLPLAVRYLTEAGKAGMGEAHSWLGRLHRGEFGGKPSPKLAIESYRLAANVEPPGSDDVAAYADLLLGSVGASPGEIDEAARKLRKQAYLGSAGASYALAEIYLRKAKVDTSFFEDAERYLRLSAENGNSDGARDLARLYFCGAGVPRSIELGNKWTERAGFLGSGRSLYLLAVSERRSGKPDALVVSNRLMRKAAMANSPDAIGFVVSRFETGRDGFPKDAEAARRTIAYVDNLADEEDRTRARIGVLEGRYDVAETAEKRSAILDRIQGYAKQGVVSAMLLRAELLDDGGTASPEAVRDAYRMAAEKGDPQGMREYGARLLAASGADAPEAIGWLRKAADRNDVYAKIALVDPAMPDAFEKLDAIAASGTVCTADQMVKLARAFGGMTAAAGRREAQSWVERAKLMVDKDADQLNSIANLYWDGVLGQDERANAQGFFETSAAAGRASAFRDLAQGHIDGVWKDASPEKAKQILLASAALGDADAGRQLLQEVSNGRVPATYAELNGLMQSIDRGSTPTAGIYMNLAKLSADRRFGTPDDARTVSFLTAAADLGDADAMRRLNEAYLTGKGVPRSAETGVMWLRRAAEKGDPKAALELAAAYEVGTGVARDPAQADVWRAKARSKRAGR